MYLLPYGAVLGRIELVGIYRSDGITSDQALFKDVQITLRERAFGAFSNGRYAWALEEPVIFKTPIPYRGFLGYGSYRIT